ncbi:glycerophosphodiester phosphodiesterase [Variovorax sp. J22P240]|uniref:glycerophosphodiester phosphodiesterase n=1 Tax=Variovorax sp. J22P240 TaxID=3053514 RepID=UPI0025782BEC|nr:glycerophosphodiester phosphodiesterase [Variovorax sp. J22P240]MDM0002989.1 glycerophosphodiester phosphodiesterase [Variovorax sp. J22P240]
MGTRLAAITAIALPVVFSSNAFALDLQAHRGGRGLLPENTLAAFENALAMGVTTLEMDVAITSDGVAVISHDAALNPALTRDAQGQWIKASGPLIKTLTLEQVQSYDVGRLNPGHAYAKSFTQQQPRDGERIPTLASVLKRVKDLGATDVQFDIETKVFPNKPNDTVAPEDFVRIMLGVIREAGVVDRVMIQSFDWRTLQMFQAAEPRIRTMYLTIQNRNNNNVADPAWTAGRMQRDYPTVGHMVKAAGGAIWAPNFNDIDAQAVTTAQAQGVQVMPWTVNEPADMGRMLDWKVDGIITDYPNRLREVMRERDVSLPVGIKK